MAGLFDDTISLFDFVAKTGNGIKGLVDSGIKEVPELYIQPPEERFEKVVNESPLHQEQYFSSVPIDLSKLDGPEHDQVASSIVRAAETFGFFQVINHGLDLALLESVKDAARRFFEQPPEAKAVYLKGAGSNINPLVKYATSFAPEKEKVLQWRDFVNMVYTNDADARNHWPKECKEEALEYFKLSYKLARMLFKILIQNLGVKVEESMLESLIGLKAVNMNFYPACPNPELTVGVARHSDMGILTVLLQDEVGGLYVKVDQEDIKTEKKEEWIEIPSIPGALVINVGDALQILSNGKYKSVEHKTRTTNKQSRVSIPLFVTPLPMEKIAPLPELVERCGGTLYREVLFQDYINNFMGNAHEGKKSLNFAKINFPN